MKTRDAVMIVGVGLAAMLGGCDGDFVADPNRPPPQRPMRALEDPYARGSANSEVMGGATGAVPLVTVDLPRTKEEQPVVRTIMGEMGTMAQGPGGATTRPSTPTTRPATRPGGEAGVEEVAAAKDVILIASQQRAADVITITRDNEANADVWVMCASGIGAVTLERTGESWPATIRVHLRYNAERPFTMLEGFNANELLGPDRRLSLKATADKAAGKGEISVPGFSRSKQILIEWVDAYR